MKTVFYVFLLCVKIAQAQSWVASGAVWSYSLKQQIPCLEAYREARHSGTVTLNGRVCDKISSSLYGYFGFQCSYNISELLGQMHEDIYTFKENNIIYLVNSTGHIDTLVDFNASPGATWYSMYDWHYWPNADPTFTYQPTKNIVLDTGHTTINGISLKTLTVSPMGIVIDRIGNVSGYFCQRYCLEVDCWPFPIFSCYWDDNFPLYSRTPYCNYNAVGIPKHEVLYNKSVYPNPFVDFLKITTDDDSSVHIFDGSAKLVHKEFFEKSGEKTIDMSHLAKGIYYVEWKNGNDLKRQKVSKQ